jgi:hypothetical protein
MKRYTWPEKTAMAGIALAGIGMGGVREFLFINLNYQLDHLLRHTRFSYAHSLFIRWSAGLDASDLLRLKWGLVAVFMAYFAVSCVLLARVASRTWAHTRGILAGFVGFAALALLLHAGARWAPGLWPVAVQVSHMLQYPVCLLFVFFAVHLGHRAGPQEDPDGTAG